MGDIGTVIVYCGRGVSILSGSYPEERSAILRQRNQIAHID